MVDVTDGKSSRQGRTTAAVFLPPFGRVVVVEAAGVLTRGFGGLKPVTATTGWSTAPVLFPADR